MNKNDLDVEWMAMPDPNGYQPQPKASMPFTGILSPVMSNKSHPLISHNIGAGKPFAMAAKMRRNEEHAVDQFSKVLGETSEYAPSQKTLQALHLATMDLVQAVVDGDPSKAYAAIRAGADPNLTVSVLDPSGPSTTTNYVPVPVGVAALLRGREVAEAQGLKSLDSYNELATMLLHDRNGNPRVSVGPAPDGNGQAVGYQAVGIRLDGENAYQVSSENRWVQIPMPVRNMIASVCPSAQDQKVAPSDPFGMVYGEELPSHARGSYLDIGDFQTDARHNMVERYRARQSAKPDITPPPSVDQTAKSSKMGM